MRYGAGREPSVADLHQRAEDAPLIEWLRTVPGRRGEVVATSESYKRKDSAMDTIASIQKSAGTATIDDETTD